MNWCTLELDVMDGWLLGINRMGIIRFVAGTMFFATVAAAQTGEIIHVGNGTLELPFGYKHVVQKGTDSVFGHIISAEGKRIIDAPAKSRFSGSFFIGEQRLQNGLFAGASTL